MELHKQESSKKFHDIGDSMWYGVSQEDSRIDKPRAQHVTALRLLHTHTAHAAEGRKSEGLFDVKTNPLETVLPFSSADLNTAIIMGWLNRYDDVSLWRDSTPGTCPYDNIVVDPTGVWTYSVDPTHPYIHEIMQRKLDMVLDSSDAKALLIVFLTLIPSGLYLSLLPYLQKMSILVVFLCTHLLWQCQ